ncbi:MAG: lipase family protein [Chloroflexi bacterium]|nr:lipase family protein [Chloroflexota bacterium]
MAFEVGYTEKEAQLMLALCDFSYRANTAMPGEKLADQEARMRQTIQSALAKLEAPNWQVVWGPALSDSRANMMYVAANATTKQMAVVIRGTVPTFVIDWAENVDVMLDLQPFTPVVQGHSNGDPRLAAGTNIGLTQIQALQGATDGNSQSDLTTFLRHADAGTDLFITGHSLGGCLASVLAATLAFQLGASTNLKIYTFAAPSPGNADFATYYNSLFTDATTGKSTAFRLYNSLDVVPNAWASLDMIEGYYQPSPQCTDEIKAVVQGARNVVKTQYQQLGTDGESAIGLKGTVVQIPALSVLGLNPIGDKLFLQQLLQQHETSVYQHLMQVAQVN